MADLPTYSPTNLFTQAHTFYTFGHIQAKILASTVTILTCIQTLSLTRAGDGSGRFLASYLAKSGMTQISWLAV